MFINPPTWMQHAKCVSDAYDPDLWFPDTDKGPNHMAATTQKAKVICAQCPVRLDCLKYANRNLIQHGIWGGMTRDERKKARGGKRLATHCKMGHAYTSENTYVHPTKNYRACKQCRRGGYAV